MIERSILKFNYFVGFSSGGFIFLLLFIGLCYWGYKQIAYRCKSCGKFGALKKNGSELIGEKPTKIKETLYRRNKKGEVTSSYEKLVDGKKKTFKVYYKCANCNHETTEIKTNTVKN